jgi:hypothetical protein
MGFGDVVKAGIGIGGAILGGGDGGSGEAAGINAAAAQQAAQQANALLQKALDAQQQSYTQGKFDLNDYYKIARSDSTPYRVGGYNALDALSRISGLPVVQGGSAALARAMEAQIEDQQAKREYDASSTNIPDGLSSLAQSVNSAFPYWEGMGQSGNITTKSGMLDLLKLFDRQAGGIDSSGRDTTGDEISSTQHASIKSLLPQVDAFLAKYQDTPATPYQSQLTAAQNDLINKYKSGTLGNEAVDNTKALQDFYDTPEAQMLFGKMDATKGPQDNFHTDPGYQFALDQGNKQVANRASAMGMLDSGQFVKDLSTFNQGIADQQYGDWRNRLSNTFNNYRNTLSTIAGLGQPLSSGQMPFQQGANLSNLGSNYANSVSNIYGQMGNNLAGGVLGAANARAQGAMGQAAGNANMWNQIGGVLGNFAGSIFQPQTNSGYY